MSDASQFDERVKEVLDVVKEQKDQEQVIKIEEKKTQLVIFLLSNHYYAFYGEYIKEIVPVTTITYVPGMPEYLPGVFNVRGEIESILDLRIALSLPAAPITKRSRIAIGQVKEIRSGLLIDSVEDVLEVPEDTIHVAEPSVESGRVAYIAGETTYKDHELILLDLGKIFETLLHE